MNKTKISLGFSSCPNDTFIFDAMIHGKIDTEGLEFELFIGDVEELNRKAFSNELAITKISYNAYTRLTNNYILLDSGSALGENCGPLIIANQELSIDDLSSKKIAIPGINTTANLLLSVAFPEVQNKVEMIFSDIEKSVIDGSVDAGLIIHESRFTYEEKGLKKIIDLGEYWENLSNTPTPLGGIIAQRDLGADLLQKINRVLKRSVQFAFDNPKSGIDFIRQHSQEMSEEVMYKHIGLYVNHYTLDLGEAGRKSVETLFKKAQELGLIAAIEKNLFLPTNKI
jgi:1,4-dihydroxy-6-naphthoate synthase